MNSRAARLFFADLLEVRIFANKEVMGACAADHAACEIASAIERRGLARIVVATGASQFAFFEAFTRQALDWSRVEVMHLDEYAGIGPEHPASFRRYLKERFVDRVHPRVFHGVRGDADDLEAECRRYAGVLSRAPVDLCVCGIGENGHLAFNDPAVADFEDTKLVKVVELDEACRRQQLGEGWFDSLDDVPRRALSQTIPSVVGSSRLIVVVPEKRKAEAVRNTILGPVGTSCPASILRRQRHAFLYLDEDSASGLDLAGTWDRAQ